MFGQSYESKARREFNDTYISLFNLMLSYLKKLFIKYNLSSKVLSLRDGIVITIGILLVNVFNKAEFGSSVVAEIIKTSEVLISESPNLLKVSSI